MHIPRLLRCPLSGRLGMIRKRNLQIVVITALLIRRRFLRILRLLVLLMNALLKRLHLILSVGQRSQREDANGVGALVDLGDADVFDHARHTGGHDVFEGVSNAREHLRVDKAPDDAEEGVHPFDAFGQEVGRGGLASLFLTLPFDFSTRAHDFFHPEPDTAGDTHCERDDADVLAAEYAPQ